LPRVTADQILRALRRDGRYIDRQARHVILLHPTKPGTVVVPRHKGTALWLCTLSQIIATAGLTADELNDLL
jgi:predicted RNA binding protein YcfA (HicA-like mRNA interferase family)